MDCKYISFGSLSSPSMRVTFISLLDHIYMSFQDKQLKSDSTKNIETQILAKHKKKEREAAKQGKRPFYLKKCNSSLPSTSFYLPFISSCVREIQSLLMLILLALSVLLREVPR